uniref:NADH-ubiquinone oxidoreductase chain 6 n=1 Tax=Chilecicada sp. PL492 TaxID=2219938 RepID=A0A3Q8GC69_9HEMI|nr:NADH dehydrogenase subunit 6 [Chilecicada sp. PL492]
MKMIIMLSLSLTMMFMFSKHPLSMGSILLMQTICSCLLCSLNMYSYMFSYILYLILVGGMLILFMYMSSIASNEKFYMSIYLFAMFTCLMMLTIFSGVYLLFESNMLMDMLNSLDMYNMFMVNKLYLFPIGILTLMMVIFLFFTLIVVSNIISTKSSPLRSSN